MNVVLVQEVSRYNRLLGTIHSSMDALKLALEGKIVSTVETEETFGSLKSNQVP